MPSYPIKLTASIDSYVCADFGVHIAEQWLEGHARDGGGVAPVGDEHFQHEVEQALDHCKRARARLRAIVPIIDNILSPDDASKVRARAEHYEQWTNSDGSA